MQIISLFVTFLRKGGDNSHPAWPAGSKGKSCLEYLGACSLAEKKHTVIKQKNQKGDRVHLLLAGSGIRSPAEWCGKE